MTPRRARTYVGISGFRYPSWRGVFYPPELPQRAWLTYASRAFDSIELNGTFYSLQSPASFTRWVAETPRRFVFAVKGSSFVTHRLKLTRAEDALANFFASGVLALGRKTGPFLWQLPPALRFDAARMERFLELLPRDSLEAEDLARRRSRPLARGSLLDAAERVPYRHAFEVRHPSFLVQGFFDLLRAHGCAFVIADTAGIFPYAEEVTADFVYVRLHGSRELYASGYDDEEIAEWAERILTWTGEGRARTLDAYVYFDNDAKVHAPRDARRLAERLGGAGAIT
ncbi:MAG: DUF72 domain-containing protein [Gemmatimonadota bacterium]